MNPQKIYLVLRIIKSMFQQLENCLNEIGRFKYPKMQIFKTHEHIV